ncbi:MAG: IS481 family transposase, partial [Gammaproteobacteria bacterium]|nr:IS481 family transposase [Gammaproteobacteria bacterium]
QRIAIAFRPREFRVDPSGVAGWDCCNDVETRYKRLMRLKVDAQENTLVLRDQQAGQFEGHSWELRLRHVEAIDLGELLNRDTFYLDALKTVAKVNVQVVDKVSA